MSSSGIFRVIQHVIDAAQRRRLARRVAAELANLRSDPAEWHPYLADGDTTSVLDGIE